MKPSGVVALLTDFGLRDHYVGVVKGVILSENPEARLVDLGHDVTPQDVASAYFLLENSYSYFPEGTVFMAVVDPGVGTERQILAVRTPTHVFVAPDNGLLSFLEDRERDLEVRLVRNREWMLPKISATFHGRDVFAPVVGRLSRGEAFERVGPKAGSMRHLHASKPDVHREGVVVGEVISVDRFGNLVTNIPIGRLLEASKVEVKIAGKSIGGLSETYGKRKAGTLVALPGSGGKLEIAVARGDAAKKLGVAAGEIVRVRLVP